MKHYLCLFRESKINQAWLTDHFIKDEVDENRCPDTGGLFSEFKRDELDYKRALDFLDELFWKPVKEVSRLKDFPDGTVKEVEGTSFKIVSPTVEEFMLAKGGAMTGIFFGVEGDYKWHQRYFLDLTRPT